MKHLHALRNLVFGAWLCLSCVPLLAAEPAQSPLLTRATAVAPNLMLILDDSNSMDYDFVYPNQAPGLWQVSADDLDGDKRPKNAKGELMDELAYCAWNVNTLYYNPNTRYLPPRKADGTFKPNMPFSSIAAASYPCVNKNGRPRVLKYAPTSTQTNYQTEAHFQITDIGTSGTFPKTARRTDCANNPCTLAEEQQNYANWFRYYRLRVDMATTALSHVIADAPDSLRFGWTRMSLAGHTTTYAVNAGVAPLGPLGSNTRIRFHNWLDGITPNTTVQGTPAKRALDRVGRYFQRQDSDGPWGTTPLPTSVSITPSATVTSKEETKDHASCRRSYTMMLTDGRYTDGKQSADVPKVNYDGNASLVGTIRAPNGSAYTYTPEAPYKDTYANTMADIAMHYWRTDLHGAANNVQPIIGTGEDPAFWQHMNFMAVTMGLQGSFPLTAGNLAALKAGTKQWERPEPSHPTAVDDLLHATMNGRGSYINAEDSTQLADSLGSMISSVLRASATQGGVAVLTVNLVAGTKKFVPVYTTGQWTGNLIANELNATTGKEIRKLWQVEVTNPNTGDEWSNTLGAHTTRKIFVGTKPGATTKATTFTYAAMNTTAAGLIPLMNADVDAPMIDYLRGNRALEAGDDPVYRKRRFLLGDIVNSNPTFIGPDIDYGYSNLPDAAVAASYPLFLNQKRSRGGGLVFVGANDGMLHAFQESNGAEVFAYVPHAVLPSLHLLARPDYAHRYFVDGPTSQGDFYDTAARTWRTVLIASAGAGAKSVFAIDATSNTLNAASVLWEVHAGVQNFAELGNVLSEAHVGQLANGTWAAIFGNGVHGKSGQAQLLVVNVRTGALIRAIDVGPAGGNGLGGVRPVLNDRNQIVGAYAGDLKGALWRFDLSHTAATSWTGETLFVTRDKTLQAITAAPLAVPHPDAGQVVVFGTGRFFDAADLPTTNVQTVYGVRDKNAFGTSAATTAIAGTTTLVMQTITAKTSDTTTVIAFDDTTSTQTITYYEVSVNPIDWKTKDGWYFHQPFSGQRVVYPVSALTNRIVKVDTIVPNNSSSDPCIAANPGAGYNYLIDALTGGSPQGPTFDANLVASGYSTGLDGRDQVLQTGAGSSGGGLVPPSCPAAGGPPMKFVIVDSSGGSTVVTIECPCVGPSCPCVGPSCPLKTIKKRSWDQLFLR